MDIYSRKSWLGCALLVVLTAGVARAEDSADEKLFEKVMRRLLQTDIASRDYPSKYLWPPNHMIMPKSEDFINAMATSSEIHGAKFDAKAGKLRPVVLVTQGMLKKVVKGDENSLAVIMGHELAHLSKDHVGRLKGDTPLLNLAFGRDQEIEADLNGLRYAIAAGYPYKVGVASAFNAMRKMTRATSFEGLNNTHPTWEDRLAILDKEQALLWTAMSAFQNGYVFLAMEQHLAAQQCFKAVVAEFPDCHEAWANLGYAMLMQYCDGLDSDDLRQYGIGPIEAGGFYSRPESLESKVRGIDEKLWKDAVKAFEKALALKPSLALPRASLGLAYLVHPEGKQAKKASLWFKEAQEHIGKDPDLAINPRAIAALWLNSAVADLARGDADAARDKLKMSRRIFGDAPALLFNEAVLEALSSDKGAKRKAFDLLETYLKSASPDSAWWPLGYDKYTKLAKETDQPAKPRDELSRRKRPAFMRMLVSVNVGSEAITLSEPAKNAVARLGKDAVEQPLFPGSKIARWRSKDRGIDLLAKDKVLAIFLTSAQAPPVTLREVGIAIKGRELRVGMAEKDAQEILKGQFAEKGKQIIADAKVDFQFYPDMGLGIRYTNGRVEELAIAQVPRRGFFGD